MRPLQRCGKHQRHHHSQKGDKWERQFRSCPVHNCGKVAKEKTEIDEHETQNIQH